MRYSSFETALSEDYRECSSDRVFIVDDKHSRSELGIERLVHGGDPGSTLAAQCLVQYPQNR
ncbi:MAG TPA: hypothetical protein VFU86_10650 [Terriglobales bacterium]|jgi:hypothetical protein|nr:hypothetical protein [Terriglobales bacterium]